MNTTALTTGRPIRLIRRILRVVLGIGAAGSLALAAFGFLFVSAIEFSGCFMECSDPDPVGGTVALIGATAAATGAVLSCGWALTMWSVRRVLRLTPSTAAILFVIGLGLVSLAA